MLIYLPYEPEKITTAELVGKLASLVDGHSFATSEITVPPVWAGEGRVKGRPLNVGAGDYALYLLCALKVII